MQRYNEIERIRVPANSLWEPIVGYRRAVRVGGRIDVSGTTSMLGSTVVAENDPYGQTIQALKTIEEALSTLGAQLRHVVRTRMYVTDISKWEEYGRAHGAFFGNVRPATTMVEVRALIDPRLLVEIEAEAVVA